MNKIQKILCLSMAMIICLLSLAGCGIIEQLIPKDESHYCDVCEKCVDPDCSNCEDKCQGHTEAHKCESVCTECSKCTDSECADEVCAEKCEGHEKEPVVKTYGIKVMSFNLDQACGSDPSKQQKILSHMLAELPDLLGVQEETPAWQTFLENALENEGYKRVGEFRATQPSHAYYGYREASSIYYNADRYDLVDSGTFWLSNTPDVEGSVATDWHSSALFPRVCTWVLVEDRLSGEQYAYFNSHFSYEHEAIRLEAAKLIMSKVEELGVPSFFSGDLNFASNEEHEAYSSITAIMDDSRTAAPETMNGNTFHNYGYEAGESYGSGTCKTVPIDYIFATKGDFEALTFKILSETGNKGVSADFYSDHFAIVATYGYTVTYN